MDECLVFASSSFMCIVNDKSSQWNDSPLANSTSDFNDFYVWVLLIIVKILQFYLLSLIPLVISLCLSSQPVAESMVITSVFKDL